MKIRKLGIIIVVCVALIAGFFLGGGWLVRLVLGSTVVNYDQTVPDRRERMKLILDGALAHVLQPEAGTRVLAEAQEPHLLMNAGWQGRLDWFAFQIPAGKVKDFEDSLDANKLNIAEGRSDQLFQTSVKPYSGFPKWWYDGRKPVRVYGVGWVTPSPGSLTVIIHPESGKVWGTSMR